MKQLGNFLVASIFATGMVSALDEAVGNITDALRKRGFMNNSLIVFTTDVSGQFNVIIWADPEGGQGVRTPPPLELPDY